MKDILTNYALFKFVERVGHNNTNILYLYVHTSSDQGTPQWEEMREPGYMRPPVVEEQELSESSQTKIAPPPVVDRPVRHPLNGSQICKILLFDYLYRTLRK